ncbi:MAG: AAA domain-containing protein [Pseudomonadota bacterium]
MEKTEVAYQVAPSRILRFWHKVEFFLPFDLQQVLDSKDAEWSVRRFSASQLRNGGADSLWRPRLPAGRRITGFEVYLGVFDKSELGEVTLRVVHEALTPDEEYEQEERGELEGPTCFARLKVNADGEPMLEEVSVSTVPWALGRIQRHGLHGLDFDAFLAGVETLKGDLGNFGAQRVPTNTSDEDGTVAGSADTPPLTGSDLAALLEVFYNWAGHRPEQQDHGAPVIVIRTLSVEDRAGKEAASSAQAQKSGTSPAQSAIVDEETDALEEDEAESAADAEPEIDILNSFYAKDIARAIASLERGEACPALERYLTPVQTASKLDLYRVEGRKHILAALAPDRLNTGHWPEEPQHAMSLMQQFALNSLFDELGEEGLFSVNGPPGTGKTTLLRDVFAENITRRARVLAGLEAAGDAFERDAVTVDFNGEQPCRIAPLRSDLTGYEMVVASSNNAAVENISRDLPKTRALGKSAWRDEQGKARIGYLKQVACNVAAKTGKGEYADLDVDNEPWGLIACALGKQANRRAFAERLRFDGQGSEQPPKGFNPERHQSLWSWRKRYQGPSFTEAREAFRKADQAVAQRQARLSRYAQLCTELQGMTLERFTAEATQTERRTREASDAAQTAVDGLGAELSLCDRQLAVLREEACLIEQERPWRWLRWLQRARDQKYRAELAHNRQQQRQWLTRRREADVRREEIQRQLQHAKAAHTRAQRELAARQHEWQALQTEWRSLSATFVQARGPDSADALEETRWQIDGLWRDDELNRLRSELLVAALGLHEAWLAEVLQKGGRFGSNLIAIGHLLSGKRLLQTEHALAIWQSLFLIVPVVSTTFASFANQFRGIGPNALGWLFIDEAGQAVPQAAVGALWRARRAVVVGDPLQIEPVFTVPIKLIEALAQSSGLPSDAKVEPHRTSVQVLADAGNPLGTCVGSGEDVRWIGSPLRVHRRCVDPMFSIANAIAYEGKMIFFAPDDPAKRLPPPDSLNTGESSWVHVPGKTQHKQVVMQQIELVHKALVSLYRRTGELPPVYVISPFRRIKDELIRRIVNLENWEVGAMPRRGDLRKWCREHIGTVHTFQGKEESIVWMVLGCDERTRGAAGWAAGKPNLLNVALTRAKHRFFTIGDANLWGELPHFMAAHSKVLPRIEPEVFLTRLEKSMRGDEADVVDVATLTEA